MQPYETDLAAAEFRLYYFGGVYKSCLQTIWPQPDAVLSLLQHTLCKSECSMTFHRCRFVFFPRGMLYTRCRHRVGTAWHRVAPRVTKPPKFKFFLKKLVFML